MTIAIDLTSLSFHISGIERYAMCVAREMIVQDKLNSYVLVFRNEVESSFADLIDGQRVKSVVLQGENKLLFLQLTLLKTLNSIGADRYLFMAFPAPWLFRKNGIFTTIHDMGAWDCPKTMKLLSMLYFRLSYRLAAKASSGIITVSDFSKSRINHYLGLADEKILVAYSAVANSIRNTIQGDFAEITRKYSLPEKYIMTLSTLEPRKNLGLLLEAFDKISERVDYDLVLIGRTGWKMDDTLSQYSSKSRIHLTGFVQDSDVSEIYRHALCFVFPSLYEGFGLPPVEALSLGCPVISSDAASLPEVLQDRAEYFKSGSTEELTNRLLAISDEMPKSLNEYQAENYSFELTAKKILNFMSK